ncbi:DUF5689 domain-containing protein [Xanthomarina spongicola]|uniref:DUF5689 domain-containing protein n=1 Tax=Xanthomarina spongicola TaxID=570520 RepID=A0A316DR93_9FLAO|nr:DUF5689 domain-containing protein [Xanthomarina spongicola]PWK20356.1 hypothetical protein LX78_00055 [Xanthomarina spongicola]
MKTNKFLKVVLGLMVTFAVVSCVQDDDYTVPSSMGDEENTNLNSLIASSTEVTIAEALTYFVPGEVTPIVTNVYVKGYVSSSDQTGNFYKEFFIQDSPSNPTAAIKIILNQVDSYNQFNLGRETYVNLNGLFIGEARSGDDVIAIGGKPNLDNEVEALTANQIPTHVLRSQVTEALMPLTLSISQISDANIGMFIEIENAQFSSSLDGEFFVDPMDDFDSSRPIESCEGFGYSYFPLETSSFANFAQQPLPTDFGGTIAGIVSKTYNGSNLVLALNSTDDINFDQAKCTPLDISDFTVVVDEDFQSAVNNTDFDFPGWTNFSEVGSRIWREKTFSGNGYTEFSTYGSGDAENIAWLVTPSIDMTGLDNVFLNFKAAQHHLDSEENTLEVFVSTDFDGTNVLGATWEPVAANLPSQANSWYEFVDSGLIDISEYSGTLYVAFKVVGSGTDLDLDGAYQIDDYKILAN